MKTDKNFRLLKRAKTMIALLCKSNDDRSHLRSMLTQSEAEAAAAHKQSLRAKGNKSRSPAGE